MKLLLITFSLLLLTSCTNHEQAEKYCADKWMILYHNQGSRNVADTVCESKYVKCLREINYAFSDLADTWGNNTNNQDSISKTMKAEIDRCLINIK